MHFGILHMGGGVSQKQEKDFNNKKVNNFITSLYTLFNAQISGIYSSVRERERERENTNQRITLTCDA